MRVFMLFLAIWFAFTPAAQAMDATKTIERGERHIEKKRYDRALELYSEFLREDPNNIDVRLRRGRLLRNMKRYRRALNDLNFVITLDPEFAKPRIQRALVYKEREFFDKAIQELEIALEISPRDMDGLATIANLYRIRERFEDAENAYTRLLRYSTREYNVFIDRAGVYTEMEEWNKAIDDLRSAMKEWKWTPWPLIHLATVYLRMERYELAEKVLDTTAKKTEREIEMVKKSNDPQSVDWYRWRERALGNVYMLRSYSKLQRGKFDEALDDIKRAQKNDKDYWLFPWLRGKILLRRAEQKSGKDLSSTIAKSPGGVPESGAEGTKAGASAKIEVSEAVKTDLRQANAAFRRQQRVLRRYYRRTEAYELDSKVQYSQNGVFWYTALLQADPNDVDMLTTRAGDYFTLKRYRSAAEDLGRVIELVPDYPYFHRAQARALAKDGQFDEAMEAAEAAIRLAQDFEPESLFETDDLEEGEEASDYSDINLDNWDLMFGHLAKAEVLKEQGKFEEALAEVEVTLAMKSDLKAAERLKSAIEAAQKAAEEEAKEIADAS